MKIHGVYYFDECGPPLRPFQATVDLYDAEDQHHTFPVLTINGHYSESKSRANMDFIKRLAQSAHATEIEWEDGDADAG